MVGNIVIVAVYVAFFTISVEYFKKIFFMLHLRDSVLPLNIFSLLKCMSLVIITLLYGGI